jgi:hypothetical protein
MKRDASARSASPTMSTKSQYQKRYSTIRAFLAKKPSAFFGRGLPFPLESHDPQEMEGHDEHNNNKDDSPSYPPCHQSAHIQRSLWRSLRLTQLMYGSYWRGHLLVKVERRNALPANSH